MKLFARFWAGVTYLLNLVTFSPLHSDSIAQVPLFAELPSTTVSVHNVKPIATTTLAPGPTFTPPGASGNDDFTCQYPSMVGFEPCSTADDRSCWLTDNAGTTFDITTDYESVWPEGVVRSYNLTISDGDWNADGIDFPFAKLFNKTYPGPWLQACWGDRVIVNITNNMTHNGTSIHWHGIRQWFTMHMDGVNGITQCPMAPQDYFVYNWTATQYGSSWYHSHYSMQYADGLAGPLTLHGPSSASYDEAADIPTLMSDWFHNSAFEAQYASKGGPPPLSPTYLLNGTGDAKRFNYSYSPNLKPPPPYTLVFEKQTGPRPKRYLLRLINMAFDSMFVFSIDNHELTVISTDFVPIQPYTVPWIHVGVGQRYNVVIEAKPINSTSTMTDFWIRLQIAHCFGAPYNPLPQGYDQAGILRYDSSSTADPQSQAWPNIPSDCEDEDYSKIHPIVPWNVGPPANALRDESMNSNSGPYPLASYDLEAIPGWNPMRIDYGNPIFLSLNQTGNWSTPWAVVPEDYFEKDWVYLVISGEPSHPMHLHGHDFAILKRVSGKKLDGSEVELNVMNPPRRDVVMLPDTGQLIIAFKADNPGSWLLHCHIASHAGGGLAAQILERRADADAFWPHGNSQALTNAQRVCDNWNKWESDCTNWWPGNGLGCQTTAKIPGNCTLSNASYCFQDDSGI